MKPSLLLLSLPGAGAVLTGLFLLGTHQGGPPKVDPSPLGPAARVLQGPLAAGRNFLLPFSLVEVDRLLREGRLQEARRAALRVLAFAPWFKPVWIQVAWSLAYTGWNDLPGPEARARRMAGVEAWLALASRVLPADPDPPATLAFLLGERMPPGSPPSLAWTRIRGTGPGREADKWLQEALRRAPGMGPLLARRSAIALRLAGGAFSQGDLDACLSFLQRALSLESRLAAQGSSSSREWVKVLRRLLSLVRKSKPWPPGEVQDLQGTGAGALFFQAAGIRGP